MIITFLIVASVISKTEAVCLGTPHPCEGLALDSACKGAMGCEWISTGSSFLDGYCDGTPTPCSVFSSEPRLNCLLQGCDYQADPSPPTTVSPITTTAPVEQTQPPVNDPVDAVTDSFCTGSPHPCVGDTQPICECIQGCEWTSTGSATWDGYCDGTPSPCSQFSNEDRLSCLKQGCAYQVGNESGVLCTGTPYPTPVCTGTLFYDRCSPSEQRICEGILGCEWISTGPATWDGYCEGTPTQCIELSDDGASCIRQLNCQYVKDPPNPEETFYDAIMPLDLDFVCQLPVDRFEWNATLGFSVWLETDIVCDKCRPSSDGQVCYTENSFWSLSGDNGRLGLVSHDNVMKIGEEYCDSEFCVDGTTAFNCDKILVIDDPNGSVTGHDCSGNCIRKFPTTDASTTGSTNADGSTPSATTNLTTHGASSTTSPVSSTSPLPSEGNDIATSTEMLSPMPAPDVDSGAQPLIKKMVVGLGLGTMLGLYLIMVDHFVS